MTASLSTATNSLDKLIAGHTPLNSRKITLLSGAGALTRGTLLGKTATAGTIVGAAKAGNTSGSGAIGSLTIGARAREGVYSAVCIEPASNAGTFAVFDPDGNHIGTATVAVAFTGDINFTIADATDFVAGDAFLITVSAVTYKYLKAIAAATDGSAKPDAILAEDADATSADAEALAYFNGDFAESALTLGAGTTVAQYRESLRQKGINIIAIQGA